MAADGGQIAPGRGVRALSPWDAEDEPSSNTCSAAKVRVIGNAHVSCTIVLRVSYGESLIQVCGVILLLSQEG